MRPGHVPSNAELRYREAALFRRGEAVDYGR
jgi:hypothetical protein